MTATCKIHGGYWYMPVISFTDDTVTIENLNGSPLTLKRTDAASLRFMENGAVI